MSITSNLGQLKAQLPEGVRLVAVSKFHPTEKIMEAYDAGQRIFGESRAQELKAKQAVLPKDIEWHFIGPLQCNKVKDIAPFVFMIQSVDSLKLLEEVNRQALKQNRVIRVLLEIHIAGEEAKHGFAPEEVIPLLKGIDWEKFNHIRIRGLMGMATFTDDTARIRSEFHTLRELFKEVKQTFFHGSEDFDELSMGMTDDYRIAIEEKTTMVRIGSYIFGPREY